MHRVRFPFIVLITLLLVLTSACEGLREEAPVLYANMIEVDYPNGMTVANGASFQFILTNKNNYCVNFPVPGGIPIYVYVNNGSVQVDNNLVYAWPSIKMNSINTTSARRRIEMMPYIDPHDEIFSLPMYSAYIPLEGSICDNSEVKVSKKIPFFIQFYTDY